MVCFCFYDAVINRYSVFKEIQGKESFEAIVGETAHYIRFRGSETVQGSKCKGRNRCEGRGLAMLSDPLCVTQVPGRSTRKQRQADRAWGPRSYLKVQLRVPYSFPLEGVGAGGEKKASMTTPQPL